MPKHAGRRQNSWLLSLGDRETGWREGDVQAIDGAVADGEGEERDGVGGGGCPLTKLRCVASPES